MVADQWERLLAHLGTLGTPTRGAEGRIDLVLADRSVVVLITPDQWDDTVGIVWAGDVDAALEDVSRAVRAVGTDDRFLLYENYELQPSPTEESAMQREDRDARRRVEEIRRRDPDAELNWYAERRDGSRARFPQPPD